MFLIYTLLPGDFRQRHKRVQSSRKGGGMLTALPKSFKPRENLCLGFRPTRMLCRDEGQELSRRPARMLDTAIGYSINGTIGYLY